MAHISPNLAQYGEPGISSSKCSCLVCNSLECFVRRRHAETSCRCNHCGSCGSKSCVCVRNNKVMDAMFSSELFSDDLRVLSDVKCSSSICSDVISPVIRKRVSNVIRAPVELNDSKFTEPSSEENDLIGIIQNNLETQQCVSSSGDKAKSYLFDMVHESRSNAKSIIAKESNSKYSVTDSKIIGVMTLKESNSFTDSNSYVTKTIPPIRNKYAELEEKLRNFIPRSTINSKRNKLEKNKCLDNEKVTIVNDVEVTYPIKDSKDSAVKLAAQIMNLSYEHFKETVSYHLPTKQKPVLTTIDIIKRIKEAYEICSCKVCECLSSVTAPTLKKNVCDCKPCECDDCKKYRMRSSFKDQTTLAHLTEYEKREIMDCKCKPCQCDECKYYNVSQGKMNKICDCTPCRCIDCEALCINRNRTVIVAPVGEGNQQPYCSCRNCGCFECAHPYGTIAQTGTRTHTQEISTETATNRPMNCACEPCSNADCELERTNTCNCNQHNNVVRKPVRNDNNDYDIRKVTVSPILGANKWQRIDNGVDESLFRTFSRDVMGRQISCQEKESNNYMDLKKPHKVSNILDIFCDCKPCECTNCKTYKLVEIKASDTGRYSSSDINSNLLDANESSCLLAPNQSEALYDHKPVKSSEYFQSADHKLPALKEKYQMSSLHRQFMLGGYINQIIYDHCDRYSHIRIPYSTQSIETNELQVKSLPNFYVFNYENVTKKMDIKKENGYKTEPIKIADMEVELMTNSIIRDSSYTTAPRSSLIKSPNSSKKNIEHNCNSCNSSSYESSEDLIQFTIPKRTTVENCIRDVIESNNFDRVLNLTKLSVAFTSGNRKYHSDSLVPRKIQTVGPENCSDMNPSTSKPIAGQIILVKLCQNLKYAEPCECHSCKCENVSVENLTKGCVCNCSACDCVTMCLHKKKIINHCKFTQTSYVFVPTDDKDCNTSHSAKNQVTYKSNYLDVDKNTIATKNTISKQPSQADNILRQKTKVPGEIKYIVNHAPSSQYSSTTKDDVCVRDSIINHNNKVQKLLEQAKSYSVGLLKVLKTYETANREFKSISKKFPPSHEALMDDSKIEIDANKQVVENEQPGRINDIEKEPWFLALKEEYNVVKNVDKPNTVTDSNKCMVEVNNIRNNAETDADICQHKSRIEKLNTKREETRVGRITHTANGRSSEMNTVNSYATEDEKKANNRTTKNKDKNKMTLEEPKVPVDLKSHDLQTVIETTHTNKNEEKVQDLRKADASTVKDKHVLNKSNPERVQKFLGNYKNNSKESRTAKKSNQDVVKFDLNEKIKSKKDEEKEWVISHNYSTKNVIKTSKVDGTKKDSKHVSLKTVSSTIKDKCELNKNQVENIHKHQEFNKKNRLQDIRKCKQDRQSSSENFAENRKILKTKVSKTKDEPISIDQELTEKDESNIIDQDLTEKEINALSNGQLNLAKSKVSGYQKLNEKSVLNKLPEQYLVKDDYDLIAQEMYKSITNTSCTDKKRIIDQAKNGTSANETNTHSQNLNIATSDDRSNDTSVINSTKDLVNDSEIDNYTEIQKIAEFVNILNFIKKHKPELYSDISIVSVSPKHESAQVSRVTIILKDDGDEIKRNDSHEIELKVDERLNYFPMFEAARAHLDLKTKAITELYGKIFRVNICILYLPKLNIDSILELKMQDIYYKKLSVKKNMSKSLDSNASSETVEKTTSEGKLAINDMNVTQLSTRRNVSITSDEALASSREELIHFTNDMPLLHNILKLIKSGGFSEMETTSTERNQTCDAKPQMERIFNVGHCSTDRNFYEEERSKHRNDKSVEELLEKQVTTTSTIKRDNDDKQSSYNKLVELDKLTGEIQSSKVSNNLQEELENEPPAVDIQKPTRSLLKQVTLNNSPKSGLFNTTSTMNKISAFDNKLFENYNDLLNPEDPNGSKVNFRSVRRVSNHTLCLKWDVPKDTSEIRGYELLVDGQPVDKILQPHRGVAVVTCLPHTERVVLTVRSITNSADRPASNIVYHRRAFK